MDDKKEEFLNLVNEDFWKLQSDIKSEDKVYLNENSDSHIMVKIKTEMPDDKIKILYEMV